jgi:hypothetical protein
MSSSVSHLLAAAVVALCLSLGGCVTTVVGTAVGATGAVAAGTIKATGKVAGATVGAGKDIATAGGRKKKDRPEDPDR